eukprot:5704520-Amphidinium_carterae.1
MGSRGQLPLAIVSDFVSLLNCLSFKLNTLHKFTAQAAAQLRRRSATLFLDVMSTVNAFRMALQDAQRAETTPGFGLSLARAPNYPGRWLTASHLGALQEGVGDELVAMVRASLKNSTRNVVAAVTLNADTIDDRIEALERDWQQKR